ncbi:MAG TPA: TfoX/Sxy family protein [Solirubrobacteraceae bacterium]
MAYDEELANLLREALADEDGLSERPMFGGLAFLLAGNMAVAVSGRGGLLVRVGREGAAAACERPHAEQAVMGSRPMTGWVRVGAEGVRGIRSVRVWARTAADFTRTLPPKG